MESPVKRVVQGHPLPETIVDRTSHIEIRRQADFRCKTMVPLIFGSRPTLYDGSVSAMMPT
jgi:hypothetical protein